MTITQGVVGTIAYDSDVIGNGCPRCTLMPGERILVWRGSATPNYTDVMIPVADITIEATEGTFERAVDAGDYTICGAPETCTTVTIAPEQVLTVNVLRVLGPATMWIFAADGTQVARAGYPR